MALISLKEHQSFGSRLDELVNAGKITDAEADDLVAAPRWVLPTGEILGYLGGLVLAVGLVWTMAAALTDASPMSIAALLYIAGAGILVLAAFLQRKGDVARRAGEVLELAGGIAWVAAVAITLNESGIRAEHIILYIAVPVTIYGFLRRTYADFSGTMMLSAGWMFTVGALSSLSDMSDIWSTLMVLGGGVVLFAVSHTPMNFDFAPRSVGVVVIVFTSNSVSGMAGTAPATLLPLTMCALLFAYAAMTVRYEILLVAGIGLTVAVGVLSSRVVDSDVTSGLIVTATGAALVGYALYALKHKRQHPHQLTTA
jgi:hypothetical protein